MIKTNKAKLIMQSVQGKIQHPKSNVNNVYRLNTDGEAMVLPATGGITYNVKIGDAAFGLQWDHVEYCFTSRL